MALSLLLPPGRGIGPSIEPAACPMMEAAAATKELALAARYAEAGPGNALAEADKRLARPAMEGQR